MYNTNILMGTQKHITCNDYSTRDRIFFYINMIKSTKYEEVTSL